MKLVIAGVLALVLKIALAACTLGTNDARTWEHDLTALHTIGFAELYRSGVQYKAPDGRLSQRQAFIHPPAVLHALRVLGNRFWLRAICAIADAATLGLLWSMFRTGVPLLMIALSPISILISGFHGNTDPIMMSLLVAAVFFVQRGNAVRAGVAFGVACSVKLVPLMFAPAILLCLPGLRARFHWLAASAVVWFALSLPYLVQEPLLIVKTMLEYSGATGLWGFGLISKPLYVPAAKWIALVAGASVPFWMKRRLFEQCGFIVLLFLFLSPGFGVQYLAWIVPWTATFARRAAIACHATAGIAALLIYTAAAQNTHEGMYADLLNPSHFPVLILMGMACWASIAVYIATLWADRNPVPPATPVDL